MVACVLYVGVRRLELPTSTSRTWRAANCATPRLSLRGKGNAFFAIVKELRPISL